MHPKPEPEARSPKPEARSPKPEARSPKPEARSPKPCPRTFGWAYHLDTCLPGILEPPHSPRHVEKQVHGTKLPVRGTSPTFIMAFCLSCVEGCCRGSYSSNRRAFWPDAVAPSPEGVRRKVYGMDLGIGVRVCDVKLHELPGGGSGLVLGASD